MCIRDRLMVDGTDTFGLTCGDYCLSKFVAAFSLEKAPGCGAAHSGENTMGGNILVLNMQNLGAHAGTCQVVAHFDCVLSITSGGNELAF